MSPLRRYPEFFEEINFTTSNEDVSSERSALRIGEGDRVLCVTASGSRPLELLADSPREIVAIDYNPLQSYLLELLMVAISRLEHSEFLGFLGVTPSDDRARILCGLSGELSDEAGAFWDSQADRVAGGVVYSGRWERLIRSGNRWRRRRARRLIASATLEEQIEVWNEVWATRWWRWRQRIFANRWLWRHLLREPGYDHIPADFDVPEYLTARFTQAATTFLLRTSPLAWLIYLGHYEPEETVPPYLDADYYSTMRDRLGAIEIVTDSLSEYLSKEVGRFDAYSVSDFSSYADEKTYRKVWMGILATASPGARVCERQFLVKRDPSELVGDRLIRDPALEDRLDREDRSMVYTFVAGTVR